MNGRELAQLAKQVCTEKEIDVLVMHWAGQSHRTIADELHLSRSAVRSRLENANRKLNLARKQAA